MFTPSRDDARGFLFDTWRKYKEGQPLAGLETIALEHLLAHPEYHPDFDQRNRTQQRDYAPESGEINPFLHLMFHVALSEQISIDQPAGIRAAFDALAEKLGDPHAAQHGTMECMAEMIWQSQRHGQAFDAEAYVECVRRKR